MKFIFINLLFLICSLYGQNNNYRLIGFQNSPYFDEQILSFNLEPEVKIQINAPSPEEFDRNKPICIALFALPNGNTTEQTIGKIMEPGDDWHFDIQHIGAQTRFLRNHVNEYNLVTVYLENDLRSWPAWKAKYSDHAVIVRSIVDSIRNIFDDFENYIVLTGHSGGGRFTFSFLDTYNEIPAFVKRISFLDSNYGYEDEYGLKIVNWLNAGDDNYLSVIAYNDSVALYNGEPIVSPTGGTWYRSKMMREFISSYFEFTTTEDDEFVKSVALDNRIKIFLKKNPEKKILHTVQVELNGFIQGMVSGTSYEEVDYTYYGNRAYSELIQKEIDAPNPLNIPPRPGDAMTGSEFMQSVMNLTFEDREDRIFEEISNGNIPNFLRTLTKIKSNFSDANGVIHSVDYEVMPDYLAIGSDEDFCRIPMGPITAQKLADLFGAAMPTRILVDNIYVNCDIKLEPVTYYPWTEESTQVTKFIEHNDDIEDQRRAADAVLGQLVGGTKKDVVISNLIIDPTRLNKVVIYGWHKLDGTPWQPLYNGHTERYVDYSHGIRFINSEMLIDSNLVEYKNILTDDILYKILSDENGAMEQPSYLKISGLPEKPNSFGIINYGPNELKILLEPDSNVESYKIFLSSNGIDFSEPIELIGENLIVDGLTEDSLYYLKLKTVNQIGESGYTEVLAGIPSSNLEPNILIVNGFDRATDGNTYNFIRQHGSAFYNNSANFNSANNEAVINGIIDLNDYSIVDYILGEESTVDETFSNAEQSIVSNYLINGGNLFVTGSEIAWDLDYKGTTSDRNFIWNFLKMKYAADAPFDSSSTYYNVELVENDYFQNPSSFFFDNGTHGTYDVKWPDVILETQGSEGFIKYSALGTQNGYAGLLFEGIFPGGVNPGKLVVLGFPFETIYPESTRNIFASEVLKFFDSPNSIHQTPTTQTPSNYNLSQNYPNPFNPSTTIKYQISSSSVISNPNKVSGERSQEISLPINRDRNDNELVQLKVYDMLGREVATLLNEHQQPGYYKVDFDASSLSSGVYYYQLRTLDFIKTKKMIILK